MLSPKPPDTLLLGPWLPPLQRQRILDQLIRKRLGPAGPKAPAPPSPGHPKLREPEPPLRLEWSYVPRFLGAGEF